MLKYKTKWKSKIMSCFPIYNFDMQNEMDYFYHYNEFLQILVFQRVFLKMSVHSWYLKC